jgi:hypothetical protein
VIEDISTLTQDIPYNGLNALAGIGFALDQFARKNGFYSFAEWAGSHFLKGCSLSGYVKAVDDLDPMETPEPGMCATTFGYEVSVFVTTHKEPF